MILERVHVFALRTSNVDHTVQTHTHQCTLRPQVILERVHVVALRTSNVDHAVLVDDDSSSDGCEV